MTLTPSGWVFLAVMAILVMIVIGMYNRLIRLRQQARAAWSDIDAQLKRRADLVDNLVETVKGYAGHEERTLSEVARWRSASATAHGPREASAADTGLTQALRGLYAVAEAYPELKADQSFITLQAELSQIETDALNARRYYNAVVRDLNTSIDTVPTNFIASFFRFAKRQYFELDNQQDRQAPRVAFGS
jgi:LemA protein